MLSIVVDVKYRVENKIDKMYIVVDFEDCVIVSIFVRFLVLFGGGLLVIVMMKFFFMVLWLVDINEELRKIDIVDVMWWLWYKVWEYM